MKRILCFAVLLFSWDARACSPELFKSVNQSLTRSSAEAELTASLFSDDEKVAQATDALDLIATIDCYLGQQEALYPKLSTVRATLLQRGTALNDARNQIEQRMALESINATVNRDKGTGFVILPNQSGTTTAFDLYGEVLGRNCGDSLSTDCGKALNFANALWWIAGQYRGFANNVNADDKSKSLAYQKELDKQWRSYKGDTIKLWPQEVLLSSLFFKPEERGFSAPPNYKLLALRPSLGLSYLSEQDHRIQPTINVDLLGIYWWKYTDGKAGKGQGLSLTAIWDGDDTALGLSYHHSPKWSATLAQGDENDLVVSLSFQLAYWFLRR